MAIFVVVVAAAIAWNARGENSDHDGARDDLLAKDKEDDDNNYNNDHPITVDNRRVSEDTGRFYNEYPSIDSSIELPPHLKRELYKEERREIMRPHITMKRPMYDNIMMLSPNGRKLSTISLKKATWYIRRALAVWVDGDTPIQWDPKDRAIQLLFEPSTSRDRNHADLHQYHASIKLNCCVSCGSGRDYMRHYVVPYCYRSLFPKHYKTHLPHDVVILCPNCHAIAEGHAHRRMNQMEREIRQDQGHVLHSTSAQVELVDKYISNVRSAAAALLHWRNKLPLAKIAAYEKLLQNWMDSKATSTGGTEGTTTASIANQELLVEASQLECRSPNPNYVAGVVLVVNCMKLSNDANTNQIDNEEKFNEEALAAFVREWRSHFLECVHPRYLPDGWCVQAPVCSDTN